MVPSNVAYNDPHNTHVNNVSPWQNFQIFEADSFSGFLAIIFGIQRLKMSKPYCNIFGSARTPSFDRYALSAPTSPIILAFPSSARMSECHGRPLLFYKQRLPRAPPTTAASSTSSTSTSACSAPVALGARASLIDVKRFSLQFLVV
jgi:hypothetical protein